MLVKNFFASMIAVAIVQALPIQESPMIEAESGVIFAQDGFLPQEFANQMRGSQDLRKHSRLSVG